MKLSTTSGVAALACAIAFIAPSTSNAQLLSANVGDLGVSVGGNSYYSQPGYYTYSSPYYANYYGTTTYPVHERSTTYNQTPVGQTKTVTRRTTTYPTNYPSNYYRQTATSYNNYPAYYSTGYSYPANHYGNYTYSAPAYNYGTGVSVGIGY